MPSSHRNDPAAAAPPPEQVILVEDDDALLQALNFALSLEGFNVVAHRSASSISADQLPTTGCLVIDHWLPGETGLSLLARLRTTGVALPAVLITSHPSAITRRRAAMLSATLVEKPLIGDALVGAIRAALAAPT